MPRLDRHTVQDLWKGRHTQEPWIQGTDIEDLEEPRALLRDSLDLFGRYLSLLAVQDGVAIVAREGDAALMVRAPELAEEVLALHAERDAAVATHMVVTFRSLCASVAETPEMFGATQTHGVSPSHAESVLYGAWRMLNAPPVAWTTPLAACGLLHGNRSAVASFDDVVRLARHLAAHPLEPRP